MEGNIVSIYWTYIRLIYLGELLLYENYSDITST